MRYSLSYLHFLPRSQVDTVRNSSGFTLIELLLSVAIVAILAQVATYQFLEIKNRARRSGAVASMAALYSHAQVFKTAQGRFYEDFRDIGFSPVGVQKYEIRLARSVPLPSPYVNLLDATYEGMMSAPASPTSAGSCWRVAGGTRCNPLMSDTLAYCSGFSPNCTMSSDLDLGGDLDNMVHVMCRLQGAALGQTTGEFYIMARNNFTDGDSQVDLLIMGGNKSLHVVCAE